ncbi:MAG: hypothetical protein IK104_11630 [Clostridia bacterium]|nr:hypothetical protein [Clostridia bacterium]
MQVRDASDLFDKLKKGESGVGESDVNAAMNKLNDTQKAKLREILSSPEKIKEILRSPKADELLRKLGKKS